MPVIPVLPNLSASLNAWSLWQSGRICAAGVPWTVDAIGPGNYQGLLLSTLAIAKGYNAIRLSLSQGNSPAARDDILKIAAKGWSSTYVRDVNDQAAIQNVPRLSTSGQPIGRILTIKNELIEEGVAGHIDYILEKCAQLGMGVILDLHDFFQAFQADGSVGPLWAEGGSPSDPYSGTSLRQALIDFWLQTIKRWPPAKYPAIIGYEILNEPTPDWNLSFVQMQASEGNNWYRLAERCIRAIRQVDEQTPIIINGIHYADAYGLKYFEHTGLLNDYWANGTPKGVADRRLVYAFHAYYPHDFTHQGVYEYLYEALGMPYPLPTGTKIKTTVRDGAVPNGSSTEHTLLLPLASAADLETRYQPVLDFRKNHPEVPLFLGEFSLVTPSQIRVNAISPTNPRRYITDIQVDADGWATVTLGQLAYGWNITVFPAGEQSPEFQGDTLGYSDYAKATIQVLEGVDPAYNVATATPIRLRRNLRTISKSVSGSTTLGFRYPRQLPRLFKNGQQVAILTLQPAASEAEMEASRTRYLKDLVGLCLTHRLSWAYWGENAYPPNAAQTLPNDIFLGWGPSSATSAVLTQAATRRST